MHLRTLENDNRARPVPNACFTGSAQKREWCPYVPRVWVGPSKASPEALGNHPLQPHLFCGCKKTRCSSYLFSAFCPTPSSAYTAKASISSPRLSCFFSSPSYSRTAKTSKLLVLVFRSVSEISYAFGSPSDTQHFPE